MTLSQSDMLEYAIDEIKQGIAETYGIEWSPEGYQGRMTAEEAGMIGAKLKEIMPELYRQFNVSKDG